MFFKGIKIQLTLGHHKEWINKSKTIRHTQKTSSKDLQAFLLDLETSKHLVQKMNEIKILFPEAYNLLCQFHINKNVKAKCKMLVYPRDARG